MQVPTAAVVCISMVLALQPEVSAGLLTRRDVESVRQMLADVIRTTLARDEDGKQYQSLVAGFVRLAFHSCLGARCEGCVNPKERVGNNGLRLAVAAAETVLARTDIAISRGDLWALGAIASTTQGLLNAAAARGKGGASRTASSGAELGVHFRYGRKDCDAAPYSTDRVPFPNPLLGVDGYLAYMSSRFRLPPRLAVAALGAHGTGVVRRLGSTEAYANWVTCADCLDNTFFRDILDRGLDWKQTAVRLDPDAASKPVWVWRKGGSLRRVKFNCDVGLVKNVSVRDGGTGEASCDYESCPASATAHWVRLYAADNDLFLRDYAAALTAIMEKGYADGELLEPEHDRAQPTTADDAAGRTGIAHGDGGGKAASAWG